MALAFEILLWLGAGLWIVFLVQTILNWILVPDVSRVANEPPVEWPVASIVVPARDEERGIREAVASFCEQDYPAFEVIVVDDGSTDATPRILAELQARYPNLRVVQGPEPPDGWLGKPNALETGRRHARGDWLLFVDADVVYAPELLRRAMCYVLSQRAAMLFLHPRLSTGGVLEAVIMSSLYLAPFSAFPMFLVSRTRGGWPAIGGGMFNLVRRDALETCGAFACIRNAVIDDVELGRTVKRAGFKQVVALSGPLIRLRMYDGARATIEGFTKNIYPLVRTHPWGALLPFALGAVVSILPYCGFVATLAAGSASVPASVSLACMHAILAGLAIHFRQPWYITFLNPLREVCWWWILVRSAVQYHRRGLIWRGRTYDTSV